MCTGTGGVEGSSKRGACQGPSSEMRDLLCLNPRHFCFSQAQIIYKVTMKPFLGDPLYCLLIVKIIFLFLFQ